MKERNDDLRPMAYPIQGDPDGAYELNSTMVVELMRKYAAESENAGKFMDIYHAAEVDLAKRHPYFSEIKIRNSAVVTAAEAIGLRYTLR